MGKQNDNKVGRAILSFVKKNFTIVIKVVIVVLVISAIGVGVKAYYFTDQKSTKLGFENIGEFATQTAYCTEMNVTDKAITLFGAKLPFTQSKYIYSYDIVIKAGFDFEEITWKENGDSIKVKLPEAKVLSCEVNWGSFKLYHEDESIFTSITIEENNENLKVLQQQAEENAIANGLLVNARANAETLLISFFGNEYDLDKYKVVFEDL